MNRAYVFPGQGSQAVGMGQSLKIVFQEASEVFGEVDEALKQNLSRLMFDGPEEELTLTENAQPALMAVSMAIIRILEKQGGITIRDSARYVAGHSLGEYSALVATGSLKLADAARLLKIRGQEMQKAVPVGIGAMAALIGLGLDDAVEVAASAAGDNQVCSTANDNAPDQVVVSGHKEAVAKAVEIAKEKGAKRAIMLSVSAPFHCPLMQPAADAVAAALENIDIAPSEVPVIANVTASSVSDPEEIRRLLVSQITAMVRWRESVCLMRDNDVKTIVEIGAGKVLSGLTKRINRELTTINIQEPADIEAFLDHIL